MGSPAHPCPGTERYSFLILPMSELRLLLILSRRDGRGHFLLRDNLQVLQKFFGPPVHLGLGAQKAPEKEQRHAQADQHGPPEGLLLVAAHGLPHGPPAGISGALGEAQRLGVFRLLALFGPAVETAWEEAEERGRPAKKTEGGW